MVKNVGSLHGFPPQARLLHKVDFDRVFQHKQYQVKKKHFLLLAAPNNVSCARLGLIAPKKNIQKAVDRNQAKRVCRSCFCAVRPQLPFVDIVILIKSTHHKSMRPALVEGFQQLLRLCNEYLKK